MKDVLRAAMISAVASLPVQAQDLETFRQCAAIDSPDGRLSCYDGAVQSLNPAQPQTETAENWHINEEVSVFTDQTDVFLSATHEGGRTCGVDYAFLFVRCIEGETSMFVSHGCYAPPRGSDNNVGFQLRFDTGDVEERFAPSSTDHRAFGWWDPASSDAMIRRLFDHDQLAIRVYPRRDPPQDLVFNIRDLSAVMSTVGEACDWPGTYGAIAAPE